MKTTQSKLYESVSIIGAFAYIEASYPRVENDTARMLSKMLNGKKCMTFYIHMYSADPANIGKFNVHLKEASTGSMRRLISLSGSQGNEWKKIRLNLSSKSTKGSFQVNSHFSSVR